MAGQAPSPGKATDLSFHPLEQVQPLRNPIKPCHNAKPTAAPDVTAVEYFQGLHRFHQPGMPVKLPAAMLAKVQTSTELARYDNEIKFAGDPGARAEAQRARQNAFKRLRKEKLQEHREDCLKKLRKDRLINGCHAVNDSVDPLNEVFPEKRRISDAMTGDSEEFCVMKDALHLLTMSSEKYHRAGEVPRNGLCPYCHMNVSNLTRRNGHIHHCRRDRVAQELGVLFSHLTFCYFCNEFYTPTEWEQDCQRHLSNSLMHCGSLTYRHTLVRPAFCLLCTQSTELAAAERLQYWERDVKALDHIDRCHGWHWTCSHCNFVSESKESGRNHLHDAHGYQFRRPKVTLNMATQYLKLTNELSSDKKSPGMLDYRGAFSLSPACRSKAEMEELSLYDGSSEIALDIPTLDPCTPPLEWSESSDDLVDRLMDEWISLPETPSPPPTGYDQLYTEEFISSQNYMEDDLMMDPVDHRAPYYLLPTQLETDFMKNEETVSPLETTAEMKWEHHSETDYAQVEEQPPYTSERFARPQIVIELRPVSNREDYQSFQNLTSADEGKSARVQTTDERDRIELESNYSSRGRKSKSAQSRKPRVSCQVKTTRRARTSFTQNEDRLLKKLKADPTLTWDRIHALFSMEFPGRRSRGTLQVHYSTKLQHRF